MNAELNAEIDAKPDPAVVVENLHRLTDRYAGFSVEMIDRDLLVQRLRIVLSGGRA